MKYLIAIVAILVCNVGMCDEVDQRIQGYLDSGEFAPAIKLANQLNDSAQRDLVLGKIANAQFQMGARDAAFLTVSDIRSDQSRSDIVSRFSSQRFDQVSSADSVPSGGAMGGGVIADFEPLIELIQTTIAPESWDEVGGPGTMSEFRSGVSVDSMGALENLSPSKSNRYLEDIRRRAISYSENGDVRKDSKLRKVSLTRLERQAQIYAAQGKPLPQEMKNLAGIYKIQYLIVYPETGDIVIAGPAGDWKDDAAGFQVNAATGKPVLNLDDLVVCLRNAYDLEGRFGCSIDPKPKNLAATTTFLASSKLKGKAWREGIRDRLGRQVITVDGIDPRTSTARTIVAADYHMKLVGVGLAESVPGVENYLDLVGLDDDGNPPPMDVARWWFTLNYDKIAATEDLSAFELKGTGVQVLSEQEKINKKGERIRTGKPGPTVEFATSFTSKFEALSNKYPVYAQLKNVFDVAIISALIRSEGLDRKVGWNLTYFGSDESDNRIIYHPALAVAPKEVDSVMNHKILESKKNGRRLRHTLVGISGGVNVRTSMFVSKDSLSNENIGELKAGKTSSKPAEMDRTAWWWD